MESSRSNNVAALALVAIFPLAYFVLSVFGVDTDAATKWTRAAAVVAAAVVVTTRSRNHARLGEPLAWSKLFIRVVLLTVTAHLTFQVLGGLFATIEPAQATPHQVEIFSDRLNMVIGLPLAMLLLYGLGVWSARLLPVKRALLWLAAVAVASRAISLSLYPAAVAVNRSQDLPIPSFEEALLLDGLHGALMFCFLGLGNLHARNSIAAAPLDKTAPDTIANKAG